MSGTDWLDAIEATLPDGDERRDVIAQLRRIDTDWNAMRRLMEEMGFRDFVRAAYLMAKHNGIGMTS